MPVYLLTMHAYRSWSEDDTRGYVQRGEGLKAPNEGLARHRASVARHDEARFDREAQEVIHKVVLEIARERGVSLHACASTPTHVHVLVSFRSPVCTCGALNHCARECEARVIAEQVVVRMKRKMGQAVAKLKETKGRAWFSRGWDLTRVCNRAHFDHLVETYLSEHEVGQAGIFRKYE